MTARLTRIDWPDFGTPALPPPFTRHEAQARLDAVRAAMAARGLSALVIYGDREHAANLHWLTGFDPRFEEALMVVGADRAVLIVGNECLPYVGLSPLVASGAVQVAHCATLSLPSQPREGRTLATILDNVLNRNEPVGAVGWKLFTAAEVTDPARTLDLPHFLVQAVEVAASHAVLNATDVFMHPDYGLRCTVDAADIARLEFSNVMAARALTRMVRAFREGITDFDAVQAGGIGGLPLSCHVTFATGDRAAQGLSSATGQTLRRGEGISFNIAHWGSNICRAGWVAGGAADLPVAARDYVDAFAGPYVAALSEWFAMMQPGVIGGDVWTRMQALLPRATYDITLNPGHLIGLDEWIFSPIAEGSALPLRSGMAMQCDVIPSHPVYGSTRMEDGYVIADDALRERLKRDFPDVAARCAARAAFMRDVIGLDVPDSLLPLADTCGIVAPYLLDAGQVITLR